MSNRPCPYSGYVFPLVKAQKLLLKDSEIVSFEECDDLGDVTDPIDKVLAAHDLPQTAQVFKTNDEWELGEEMEEDECYIAFAIEDLCNLQDKLDGLKKLGIEPVLQNWASWG